MDRKNHQKRQPNHERSNKDYGKGPWGMTEQPGAWQSNQVRDKVAKGVIGDKLPFCHFICGNLGFSLLLIWSFVA